MKRKGFTREGLAWALRPCHGPLPADLKKRASVHPPCEMFAKPRKAPAARAQATPGPWTVDPEGAVAVAIEGADGVVVCDVHGAENSPLREANASLIAAAPVMRDALDGIRRLAESADRQSKRDERTDLDALWAAVYEMRNLARAALKAAR